MERRVQDTSEMFNFIDYLKNSNNNILTEDLLVSFDIVLCFPVSLINLIFNVSKRL